jgi:hypothetical protein
LVHPDGIKIAFYHLPYYSITLFWKLHDKFSKTNYFFKNDAKTGEKPIEIWQKVAIKHKSSHKSSDSPFTNKGKRGILRVEAYLQGGVQFPTGGKVREQTRVTGTARFGEIPKPTV